MTLDLETARTRLAAGYYNAESVTEANPGGMGADGHKTNLPEALEAVGLVGTAAAEGEETATTAAATATTQAGIATAAAGTATTKAGEASDSADAAAASAAAAAGAVGGVKVSGDDTLPGDLETKILAGDGIVLSTQNPGGAETRTVAVDPDLDLDSPTVSTLLTLSGGMQSKALYLGDVSGEVVIEATDPLDIYCTIVGDTVFLVAGGTVPGCGHQHLIHWEMGGAGGYAVTILPANLWPRSNEIDHSDWTKTRATTSTGAGTAPDGQETAVKLVEDGTAANTHSLSRSLTKAASALTYTFEGTFERAGRDIAIAFDDAGANGVSTHINLATGAVITPFAAYGSGWAVTAAAVTPSATGGYDITLTFTTATATTLRFFAYLRNAGINYSGDSTSGVIISWLNLVEGSVALGRNLVGATRAGQVVVQGLAVDFPAMAAGESGDLGITYEPSGRIVMQDHTVEEA